MIKVDEVNDGVFQVVFTGIDLRLVSSAARRGNISRDAAMQGLLTFVVGVYGRAILSERSTNELEGKNEGMGRG